MGVVLVGVGVAPPEFGASEMVLGKSFSRDSLIGVASVLGLSLSCSALLNTSSSMIVSMDSHGDGEQTKMRQCEREREKR